MASLVAYDDSDSEAETEAAGSVNATSQMTDTRDVVKPRGQDFAPGGLDVTEGGALATKPGSCEDPAGHRLPLARLWRSDPGSCPSRRLQWPRTEPEVTFPTNEPPCPSLWASHTPAGHVPLAAAHVKQVKPSWGTAGSPELSFCAQTKCDTSGTNGSSLQRRRREDCVIPYTPKRLRQLEAVGAETGKSNEAEARGPCARRAPAPLCVASRVSEFIQPYLDSPYKETKIPRSVLFHLRGHRGPVNGVQWCPVPSQSHMLLSASMDKTFRVRLECTCSFQVLLGVTCWDVFFFETVRWPLWQGDPFLLGISVILLVAFRSWFLVSPPWIVDPFCPTPPHAHAARGCQCLSVVGAVRTCRHWRPGRERSLSESHQWQRQAGPARAPGTRGHPL